MNPRPHITASLLCLLAAAAPAHALRAGAALEHALQPATPSGSTFTTAELEELLGPIALYPDTLLANVLAACVYPDEVAEAAALVKSGGGASAIDQKAWEAPVKSVAKLPDVIGMMGEFPDWTVAMGQTYLTQAQDVMSTVQSLRKKAQANGALATTPQQTVVVEQETIYIQPADPQIVYVPSYEPQYVYVDHHDSGDVVAAGLIGFGTGILLGAAWADLDCDWHGGCVGWGGGDYHHDVDVDIDREFNGDINIGSGNNINRGDRVNNRPAGQEGNAFRPNKNKQTAANRPSQVSNMRGQAGTGARPTAPRASTADRARAGGGARPSTMPSAGGGARPSAQPAGGARPTAGATRAPSSASRPSSMPSRMPSNTAGNRAGGVSNSRMPASTPTAGRGGDSAFRGGAGTQAQSNRGAASRSSAQRSSGGGGGGSRGGGGRGGGGRR